MNTFNDIVKSIFERALELDKLSRESFFNNLQENEKKYVDEVKSLIAAFEKNDDFLEIETENKIFADDNIGPHPLIGKHIGPYLIEEEIGIGGMGIVFVGKRDDQEFEQKVAIKILKQGLSSEYLVKRFQNERQTLANLQHPNIAKLFDGGKTSEGLPFLVMEFIDGLSITNYSNEKDLPIEDRLKLFINVCSAVHYAHQNLVIHRDIKPGNILVNNEGRVKLLDFGISKLLDDQLYTTHNDLTKTGMWHLTPEYASPEQIKGENITTSSDIYSLGVLLYNLITGSAPYKIYNSSPLAINKVLEEGKILKPSQIILNGTNNSTGKLDKLANKENYKKLKGDLDNIVFKAMHKDPSQRYLSAQEFSEDIFRYLNGLPIKARRDTYIYRFNKFVKRHKVGVGLFVLLNLIILFSIIAIVHQGRIAAEERDKAKTENAKFVKVNSFLQEMLSSVDPSELGRDVKVYDILDKAAENAKTELEGQPEIEAAIRSTLGNTYVNLGEYDKGKPFLDKSLEINRKLYGEESKEFAHSLHDLGLYYDWVGKYKIADSLYTDAIILLRKTLDKPTKLFSDALNNHAIIKMNFSQYDEAEKLYMEAIETAIQTQGEKNRNVAVMMNNLAISYMDVGKFEESEKFYKKSLKIILEVVGTNRPEIASSYNNMARLYMIKGELDSAEVYLKKSYQLKFDLKGKDRPDVGLALNNLGVLQVERKNFSKAEDYFIRGISQYEKTYEIDHPLIAISQNWLGKVSRELKKYEQSEDYFRKCLNTRLSKLPEDNWEIWETKGELGITLLELEKYNESEKLLKSSFEFFSTREPQDTNRVIIYLSQLVQLLNETNQGDKLKLYQTVLNSYQ